MKDYDCDDLNTFICPVNLEELGIDKDELELENEFINNERYLKFIKCFGGLANIFKMK